MIKPILALLGAMLCAPAFAQAPGPNPDAAARLAAGLDRLAFRPDPNGVAAVEALIAAAPGATDENRAKAAALRAQAAAANRAGRTGEALRLLNQAISAARGSDWSADAFGASLVADIATPVADAGRPVLVQVRGAWPEAPAGGTLTVRFTLMEGRAGGAVVRDLGSRPMRAADLVADPQWFAVRIRDIPPGHYRLQTEVRSGSSLVARLLSQLDIVAGIDGTLIDVMARLAKIEGHDDARATILYPFSLARDINTRTREVITYDFTAEIARALVLLAELEAGRDPVFQARGDQHRAYYHADAATNVPYRLYVPSRWDGKAALPMVVFLHGANADENNGLDRGGGVLAKLAEARGYIVVSPLGYRMNSSYGAVLPREASGFGVIADPDPRRLALSEQDVLTLADRVAKEYGADPDRIYLMGNSMGGMGSWHLAAKYPRRWAAVSPAAGGVNADDFPYANLKGLPIRAVGGELDPARSAVEKAVAAAKANGADPRFVFVPGGTHGSAIEIAMPATFDFFAKHRRKLK